MNLHIDLETYSSEPLKNSGSYRYFESPDFEILILAYCVNEEPVQVIDLSNSSKIPNHILSLLMDPKVRKLAHNANFERNAFKAIGYEIPIDQWDCTMVRAAYCGLPLSLGGIGKALRLEENQKLDSGKNLIRYFCNPCKPTKANGERNRNLPKHDPEKWEEFKEYCRMDVVSERVISEKLKGYPLPEFEIQNYIIDQEINDRGILIDVKFANQCLKINKKHEKVVKSRMKEITQVENPNSVAQLKDWIGEEIGEEITSLAKEALPGILEMTSSPKVEELIKLRKKASKTSTKKYKAMVNCVGEDHRARGLFQFYGANRTGRWAGRLIQLQNLPQNKMDNLEQARNIILSGDYETAEMLYKNVASVLSELIRTAFIAKPGHILAAADFSAIEARVIAWLAEEDWRLEVFESHGKIYEASASMMFDVPMESITKDSPLRQKGKVAELALGFGGSIGAMTQMGAGEMGISEPEIREIVHRWRAKSPNIVKLWKDLENCAKIAVKKMRPVRTKKKGIIFDFDGQVMTIQLPSGKKLFYQQPSFTVNKWGNESLRYKGPRSNSVWGFIDTYGGKLSENIVQAIARDLLAYNMQKIREKGYEIVMHVHDEVVCEIPQKKAEKALKDICDLMSEDVPWAPGLPNNAEGFLTCFYKK